MNAKQIFSVGRSLTTNGGRTRLVAKTLGGFIWKGFTVKRIALAAAMVAGGLLLKQIRGNGASVNVTADKSKTEMADAKKKSVAHSTTSSSQKSSPRAKAKKPAGTVRSSAGTKA